MIDDTTYLRFWDWNSDYHSNMWHDIHMFGGYTGRSCCIQSTECSWLQFCICLSHLCGFMPSKLKIYRPCWVNTHTFNKHWHHQPINTFTEASMIIWRWCPSSPALVVAWLIGKANPWPCRAMLLGNSYCRTWTKKNVKRIENRSNCIDIHEFAQLSHMFMLIFMFTVLLILSRLSFFYTCEICWCNNW